MDLLTQLKLHLRLFGYFLLIWLGLIGLEVLFGFNGILAGLAYWLTLIILFVVLWYLNLKSLHTIPNEVHRFLAAMLLTSLITTVYVLAGLAFGVGFKHWLSG